MVGGKVDSQSPAQKIGKGTKIKSDGNLRKVLPKKGTFKHRVVIKQLYKVRGYTSCCKENGPI